MIKNFNADFAKLKIIMDSHLSRRVSLKKSGVRKTKIKVFKKIYKGGNHD